MKARIILISISLILNFVSIAQRGQVHESEWRDPEDGETSWFGYITTLAIIFGIGWVIKEIVTYKDKQKNN